jgi:predicted nucleic acid-binding protein
MIFADTGALFAAFVPNDPDYAEADAWLVANRELLVTTDYVVDELLTLFKMRGEYHRAFSVGSRLLSQEVIQLEWVARSISSSVSESWRVIGESSDTNLSDPRKRLQATGHFF